VAALAAVSADESLVAARAETDLWPTPFPNREPTPFPNREPSAKTVPNSGTSCTDRSIDLESNKDFRSNRLEIDRSIEPFPNREPSSARGYIEEKLSLPKLQRLRQELTGANQHMSRKFVQMLREHPEQLAEWIGEAASPGIADPCKFLNAKMSSRVR
jgi:hypothetical protein